MHARTDAQGPHPRTFHSLYRGTLAPWSPHVSPTYATQASPEQLLAALAAEGALLLRGRWRAVDRTYLGELLEHLLLA